MHSTRNGSGFDQVGASKSSITALQAFEQDVMSGDVWEMSGEPRKNPGWLGFIIRGFYYPVL